METIKKTLDLDEHQQTCTTSTPEGPTYTTIMEVPKTKIGMVFWGPNSIGSVHGPFGELVVGRPRRQLAVFAYCFEAGKRKAHVSANPMHTECEGWTACLYGLGFGVQGFSPEP